MIVRTRVFVSDTIARRLGNKITTSPPPPQGSFTPALTHPPVKTTYRVLGRGIAMCIYTTYTVPPIINTRVTHYKTSTVHSLGMGIRFVVINEWSAYYLRS